MMRRLFYVAGPGDIIGAYKSWKRREPHPTEVSRTFSGQVHDLCEQIGAEGYFVSSHDRVETLCDGRFTLEHRPKPGQGARGAAYHRAELSYALGLLRTARGFRADAAVVDTGGSHCFLAGLFRLAGIPVVPVLHCTLWPNGFPPARTIPRLLHRLNGLFFGRAPLATVGVSPECLRQVEQLTGGRARRPMQCRAQFYPEHFARIATPPAHDRPPFGMIFVGRIVAYKGVFDLLEIARGVEARLPGRVRWEVCGTGPDLDALRARHEALGLCEVVRIRGWTSPADQVEVYNRSHAAIVPTRGEFAEGLAMTAAEAVLAGRPVVTSPVVPALEVLRPACVGARPNDVGSYVEAVVKLATDAEFYGALARACPGLQGQFYDPEQGLTATLRRALEPIL